MTFRWKNYARGNQPATMTLQAAEFMRRFLLQVLPRGFVKVRHFGLLANRGRRRNLALCRKLLAAIAPARDFHPVHDRLMDQAQTEQRDRCPRCRAGRMRRFETLLPQPFVTAMSTSDTILLVMRDKKARAETGRKTLRATWAAGAISKMTLTPAAALNLGN